MMKASMPKKRTEEGEGTRRPQIIVRNKTVTVVVVSWLLVLVLALSLLFILSSSLLRVDALLCSQQSLHYNNEINHRSRQQLLLSSKQQQSSSTTTATATPEAATPIMTDDDLLVALQRLEELDEQYGTGRRASNERSKLHEIIEEWALQQEVVNDDNDGDKGNNNDEEGEEEDVDWDNTTKYVTKHSSSDRIAIFGGDPKRRRAFVEKKLQPYKTLDQYGTPKDVGERDTSNLVSKIQQGKYDVVYIWTKFNCHPSRRKIRNACMNTKNNKHTPHQTRFEEVHSLTYIR